VVELGEQNNNEQAPDRPGALVASNFMSILTKATVLKCCWILKTITTSLERSDM
jgi:hypothetical protein